MSDAILKFLQSFIEHDWLIVFLSSMIPLIELKGAIPVGAALGMNIWGSAGIAYLGSTFVAVPVFFLLIPVFGLLKKIKFIRKFVEKTETMLKNRAAKMAEKSRGSAEEAQRKLLVIGLFVFVAIPLPVTGVWTGTAIAVFLGMRFRDSILPLAAGNLVAGSIITLLITAVGAENANIVLYIVLALAAVMLVVTIIKIALSKPKETANDGNGDDDKLR